jgi:hypothetical protein
MKAFPEERIAEGVATAVLVFGTLYIFGHVIAAWLRGSFQAVIK